MIVIKCPTGNGTTWYGEITNCTCQINTSCHISTQNRQRMMLEIIRSLLKAIAFLGEIPEVHAERMSQNP